ncbi:hypothetical protein BB559_003321 [Furculomyces boomerangus]|uniref:TM7S3/TM198-like domain-containing protein n=2 Tax=Harpellales TaxID=61421 RepID=A0A2T9YLW9_9FUNG|nr:hypothetical protein BB559_005046 [Furculomyces boomerangus]PVU93335.1 hypothetical protein BB559_003321 [Furculomyces boomerangus]PWA01557.1 hypothetical protein BB558_002338 [Smittium angustum]
MLVAEIILAVSFFIPAGLFVAFFANKHFRFTSYIAGFFIVEQLIAAIGYQISLNYNNSIVPSVAIIVSLGLAIFFVIIPVLGFAGIGALVGYSVAKFVVILANTRLFTNDWVNIIYLGTICGIFVALIFYEEYGVYIVGTAFWGGMLFIVGIDVFSKTGINNAILQRWNNSDKFVKTNSAWVLIATWFWITILGALIQNKFATGKVDRHTPYKINFPKRKGAVDASSV